MAQDQASAASASTSASTSKPAHHPRTARKCTRCGERATLLLRKTLPSCTACAQAAVENRAKGYLEHARGAAILDRMGEVRRRNTRGGRAPPPPPGGVALAFSGGASSRALLDIAARNLRPPPCDDEVDKTAAGSAPRKSRPVDVTRIDVIYIDDSAVIPGQEDQTEAARRIVEEQGGRGAGLNFVPLKLEDLFRGGGGGAGGDDDDDDDDDNSTFDSVDCIIGPAETRYLVSAASGRDAAKSSSSTSSTSPLSALFSSIYPPNTPRASIASARSRAEDLHALLVRSLLIRTARKRGCSALLLGDSGSRGAISLIDGIAKGRGYKWAIEGAPVMWHRGARGAVGDDDADDGGDEHHRNIGSSSSSPSPSSSSSSSSSSSASADLLVLRPLRDALAKELAFFNKARGLDTLTTTDVVSAEMTRSSTATTGARTVNSSHTAPAASSASTTGALEKASIGRLTENFIYALERGVPSTVSTVGRTGSKLVLKSDDGGSPSVEETLAQSAQDISINPVPPPRLSGLGQKGDRLIATVRQLPQWSAATSRGCVFCQMPTQRLAHQWRAGVTIKRQEEGGGDDTGDDVNDGPIPLHEYLCYSCTLVLDVPDEVKAKAEAAGSNEANGPTIPLPAFVARNVQRRRMASSARSADVEARRADLGGDIAAPAAERQSSQSHPTLFANGRAAGGVDRSATSSAPHHVTRPVGRDEIKERVGRFLLEEAEEP